MQSRLLDSIDARIAVHATLHHLTPEQTDRARSMAYSAALASLVGLTAAQMFELIRPTFEEWQATQRLNGVTVESEVR